MDYFICEAGIGGKYDTTSVIQSKTVVLTSIGLDHTDILGNKITDILNQKINVSDNIETLFVSVLNEELIEIIKSQYTNYSQSIYLSEYLNSKNILLSNLTFKELNYYLSLMVVDSLLQDIKYADLTNIKIQEAKGRFEIVNDSPIKIIDGAHNYEGVEILLRNYEKKYGQDGTMANNMAIAGMYFNRDLNRGNWWGLADDWDTSDEWDESDEIEALKNDEEKLYKVDGRHKEPDATGMEEDPPSAAEDCAKSRGNYEI